MPWEGYSNKKLRKRKEEFEAKDLHVDFEKGKEKDLLEIFGGGITPGWQQRDLGSISAS